MKKIFLILFLFIFFLTPFYSEEASTLKKVTNLETQVNIMEKTLGIENNTSNNLTISEKIVDLNNRINVLNDLLSTNSSFKIALKYKFTLIDVIGETGFLKGQFIKPSALTGDTRYLFICDTGNNRIVKYNMNLKTFDLFDNLPEEMFGLSNPMGILLYKGTIIFVSDTYNSRIVCFTYDGVYKMSYGELGINKAEFDNPQGLAIDIQGNLYIADSNNNRIQCFNLDFFNKITNINFRNSYKKSFGEDKLYFPTNLLTLKNNNIIVADTKNNSLKLFDTFGNLQETFFILNNQKSLLNTPLGIRKDTEENLYLADSQNKRVLYFDQNQNILGIISENLEEPADIFINGNTVYVSDRSLNKIFVFRRDLL